MLHVVLTTRVPCQRLSYGAAELAGQGDRGTFPVPHPTRRIDALLVDPRLEVREYRVVDTPDADRASDHYPILVDLA